MGCIFSYCQKDEDVNEYSETMVFDPRFSLSYGYVF